MMLYVMHVITEVIMYQNEDEIVRISLSKKDFNSLSPGARAEIRDRFLQGSRVGVLSLEDLEEQDQDYRDIDMDGVVDLTYKQVREWMEAASDSTRAGLRVFAEHGPIIREKMLKEALEDASNKDEHREKPMGTSHFQSRTTVRTRTVTRNKDAFLLGWDDWYLVEEGEGRYAVTPTTYESLRRYFGLDKT